MLIFIIILIIILIFFLSVNKNLLNQISSTTNSPNRINDVIKILVRQSARWAAAAKQDKNPLIAVLHSNYAAGYLWALKDITSSQEVKSITNIDLKTLEKKITQIQDNTTKHLAKLCPEYTGETDKLLAAIAGEGNL